MKMLVIIMSVLLVTIIVNSEQKISLETCNVEIAKRNKLIEELVDEIRLITGGSG